MMLRKFFSVTGEGIVTFDRRHPLFVVALFAATCVLLASVDTWFGLTAAGLIALARGCFWKSWRQGLVWLACGVFAAGNYSWTDAKTRSQMTVLKESRGSEVRGIALSAGKGELFWVAPVELIGGAAPGAKVWWQGRGDVPVAGSVLTASGTFQPLPEARNPGEFDLKGWLKSQGIAAVFEANHANGTVATGKLARLAADFRAGFRKAVTLGLEDESQEARVIRAIVIGEQPDDSEVLIAAFRNSGTLHAFSVSGLHVSMVGLIGWTVLSLLGVPRRPAVLVLLPLIFGYSWLTGNHPPAVRSAWMAMILLSAFVFRRRPDLLNSLGLALLVAVLYEGRLIFQPGVQLSYGVVAAISLGSAATSRIFAGMTKPELYLPLTLMTRWQKFLLGSRRWLAQSLGVSLAAGIGSTPLTAIHFGLVTPVSVIAGIPLIPMVFVLLCASLLAASISPIAPQVSRLLNRANGKVADLCVLTARGFSAIPGGNFPVGKTKQPYLLVYDLEYGAGAACFSGGAQGSVLIDCADPYVFKRQLLPSLRRLGLAPDSVILTHPDGRHLGGGAQVWEALPIRQAILPVELSRSPAFRSWKNDAPAAGIKLLQAAAIPDLPLPDDARLEVLHAPNPTDQSAAADDRIAIFRLHWRGWKILLTSDAGASTESALIRSGKDISADVIIAGHHRSDISLTDRFLDAVNPKVIVASNSAFPVSEILNPKQIQYWRDRGIIAIDQSTSGGVTVMVDEASGALKLEGFADHSVVRLPR